MKTCGNCKFWVPETSGLVSRARAKYPRPHCELSKETKHADDKPCMVWIGKKKDS